MLDLWCNRFVQWVVLGLVIVALNPGDNATIQWTPGDDKAQWYEVRERWRDVEPQTLTEARRVEATQTIALRPRSGHWAVEVRACALIETKEECSEWVKSDEKGEPEPWVIFWKPPKPWGIKVEDE